MIAYFFDSAVVHSVSASSSAVAVVVVAAFDAVESMSVCSEAQFVAVFVFVLVIAFVL